MSSILSRSSPSKPSGPTELADRVYRVPSRFGLASILVMMTLLAFLFGLLRSLDAAPSLFLFFGSFCLIICLAQMTRGDVPRGVSVIAGCVFLPLWFIAFELFFSDSPRPLGRRVMQTLSMSPILAMGGAILGYLTGVVAAGVFLILDELSQHDSVLGAVRALAADVRETYRRGASRREEKKAFRQALASKKFEANSSEQAAPQVRQVGSPESVPVFNCRLLIKQSVNGTFTARCAVLDTEPVSAPTKREALQQAVTAFKATIGISLVQGTPIPWLEPPLTPAAGEVELWVPVHF